MTERNRVLPTGEIAAVPLRGEWMGNRGCLHDGHDIVRPWRSRAWITCRTSFRDRRVPQWVPGRYTVLFFHDEAVALAAGHRPCAECRRDHYRAFLDAWERAHGRRPRAPDLDAALHAARLDGRRQRTHERPWSSLPVGTFVRLDGAPALVVDDALVRWDDQRGYGERRRRPATGRAEVLTPSPTVEALRAGYPVRLHETLLG